MSQWGETGLLHSLDPLIIGLELQPKLPVIHPKIAVGVVRYRLWHHLLHFLCHDANVCLIAAVVAEAVQAKPVVQVTDKNDVVLEPDIRSPTAATTATTSTTSSSPAISPAAAALMSEVIARIKVKKSPTAAINRGRRMLDPHNVRAATRDKDRQQKPWTKPHCQCWSKKGERRQSRRKGERRQSCRHSSWSRKDELR